MRRLSVLLLAALLPAARALPPALAQEPPNCIAGRDGMVACFGEKLCECRWDPGGIQVGRPPGHRWDCGTLRPACGTTPASPPVAETPQATVLPLLPSHVTIPRSPWALAPRETR